MPDWTNRFYSGLGSLIIEKFLIYCLFGDSHCFGRWLFPSDCRKNPLDCLNSTFCKLSPLLCSSKLMFVISYFSLRSRILRIPSQSCLFLGSNISIICNSLLVLLVSFEGMGIPFYLICLKHYFIYFPLSKLVPVIIS